MIVNISEAKAKLSKLVDLAYHGETVVISKNNLPLVELVAFRPKGRRQLGLVAGKFEVPDDFDDECEEINAMFYGDDS